MPDVLAYHVGVGDPSRGFDDGQRGQGPVRDLGLDSQAQSRLQVSRTQAVKLFLLRRLGFLGVRRWLSLRLFDVCRAGFIFVHAIYVQDGKMFTFSRANSLALINAT